MLSSERSLCQRPVELRISTRPITAAPMNRSLVAAALCLLLTLTLAACAHDPDKPAQQTGDLGVADALSGADPQKLESLLHWAIEHSDPDKLRQQAHDASGGGHEQNLEARRQRVKELSDIMSSQPTETDLMKVFIGMLSNPGSTEEQKLQALARLQELVEPIDHANDLRVLGGLQPLLAALKSPSPGLQEAAAYVLGTAASNNHNFQAQLLQQEPDIVQLLLKLVLNHDAAAAGVANKAMYALSTLVRNSAAARISFLAHGGLKVLTSLMGHPSVSTRVKDRAMNLMTDLADLAAAGEQGEQEQQHGMQGATWDVPLLTDLAGATLQLLQVGSDDWDRKEKALLALRSLPARHGAAGVTALVEAGAESTLREVLTELEVRGPAIQDEQQLQHEDAMHAGQQQQARPGGGEGGQEAAGDGYLDYIVALCADLLHSLSVWHEEL